MGHPPEQDAIIEAEKEQAERKPVRRRPAKPRAAKARAAATEKKPEPKTVDFRGLTLTLPPDLPGSIYFDLATLSEEGETPAAQVRLLASLIGADQVQVVREKVTEERIPLGEMEDVLATLFGNILDSYGTSEGESAASPES